MALHVEHGMLVAVYTRARKGPGIEIKAPFHWDLQIFEANFT